MLGLRQTVVLIRTTVILIWIVGTVRAVLITIEQSDRSSVETVGDARSDNSHSVLLANHIVHCFFGDDISSYRSVSSL